VFCWQIIQIICSKNFLAVFFFLKEKTLVLAAIRVFRALVLSENITCTTYIIDEKLFDLLLDVFKKNGNKYNLVNSAILDIFENLKKKNIRPLIKHVIDIYYDTHLKDITYTQVFKQLKDLDEHQEQLPDTPPLTPQLLRSSSSGGYGFWHDKLEDDIGGGKKRKREENGNNNSNNNSNSNNTNNGTNVNMSEEKASKKPKLTKLG